MRNINLRHASTSESVFADGLDQTANLPHSSVSDKPRQLRQTADGFRQADPRRGHEYRKNFEVINAQLSREFEQTRDTRTPYALDTTRAGSKTAVREASGIMPSDDASPRWKTREDDTDAA